MKKLVEEILTDPFKIVRNKESEGNLIDTYPTRELYKRYKFYTTIIKAQIYDLQDIDSEEAREMIEELKEGLKWYEKSMRIIKDNKFKKDEYQTRAEIKDFILKEE